MYFVVVVVVHVLLLLIWKVSVGDSFSDEDFTATTGEPLLPPCKVLVLLPFSVADDRTYVVVVVPGV